MKEYNTTQLSPAGNFERHVYHRDQFAHYLRWTHVLKNAKIGDRVLDIGCGSGNMLEVFYRNRFKCEQYLGVDIRKKTIDIANIKWDNLNWASFKCLDLIEERSWAYIGVKWDTITCFEVLEHVGKENASKLIRNISGAMDKDTVLLISTPVFNGKAAKNHIINGEVGEFGFQELKEELEKWFVIENVWGTFASQSDYKDEMDIGEKNMFDRLSEYYDSNLLSVIFAPLHPRQSRNCIWRCKLK